MRFFPALVCFPVLATESGFLRDACQTFLFTSGALGVERRYSVADKARV